MAYSRKFADYLSGGFTIRGISESIADARAFGVSMDVGIQYITGSAEHPEQIKMGVALRNIGSPMRFQGDGVTFSGQVPEGLAALPLLLELRILSCHHCLPLAFVL